MELRARQFTTLPPWRWLGRVDGGGPGEKATYDLTKNGKEYANALQLGGWVVTNT